jgi:hypothetical protein
MNFSSLPLCQIVKWLDGPLPETAEHRVRVSNKGYNQGVFCPQLSNCPAQLLLLPSENRITVCSMCVGR